MPLRTLHKLHERKACHALAAAAFADDADGLALRNVKRYAVDGFNRADVRKKVGMQVNKLRNVFRVPHRGHILFRRNMLTVALFFYAVGNAPVIARNLARFRGGDVVLSAFF
ncbi:hypothetical protein SDC9_196684 [bioreactor metagenome]|uniref:Uncharacterized protein n=1 Tax=bioreactor metagenome TaxID=1076179 RepID=A0A645ICJ0_9ZZZZ